MEKHNCPICSHNPVNIPDHSEKLLFNETWGHNVVSTLKDVKVSHSG